MSSGPVRVLVADDHPVVVSGLRAVVDAQPDMMLVGTASDGAEAVEIATLEQPDVIVMDLHMPRLDGVEATRRIMTARPETAVLILTMHEDDDALVAAVEAGARGYLLKGAGHEDIVRALHTILSGQAVFGTGVVSRVARLLRPSPAAGGTRTVATVCFTDIVGSTRLAIELGDRAWREMLDRHDETVRRHVTAHGGRYVKSTGDGCLATFQTPGQAISAAASILADLRSMGIQTRAGLHTGECDVREDDVGGIAVHIAARVAALADPYEVLVSQTVKDLVAGSSTEFAARGTRVLRGLPDRWRIYAVKAT